MKKICIINGPNLNMLGVREPGIYGSRTLDEINSGLADLADRMGVLIDFFQSNHEGVIVDKLQECYENGVDGIILNPGALTHQSYVLRDAIASVNIPVIEVHLSNIHAREDFRKESKTAPACIGQISGLGAEGYFAAMVYFCNALPDSE